METVAINRAALGSTAALGDLYDARRDDFCGISIFQKSIPEEALTIADAPFSDIQLVHSDNFSDKTAKLDVSAELSVSVMAGLFTLEGSARYLSDQKQSARTVKSSLIYNIKTKDETVNIYHEDLKDAFSIDAIESGVATHVVVGISWGANSILTCTYENRENRDVREISGSLSASLKKATLAISGKASVEFTDNDIATGETFDIRMFGDILAENEELPTTFMEALNLMKKVPGLVSGSNDGKGKPLTYKLLPISLLQDYLQFAAGADTILQKLEEASLIRVINFFDELASAQQELNDFYEDCLEFKHCVEPETIAELADIKTEITIQEASFRSQLSSVLTQVRSSQADAAELETLLESFQGSDIAPQSIETKLLAYSHVLEKIKFAQALKKHGATYIGLGSTLDDETLNNFDDKSYVLYFCQDARTSASDEWTGNRQLFFQELKKKEEGHRFYAVDCDIHKDQTIGDYLSCIQVIQAGKVLSENLLKEREAFESIPFVQIISGTERTRYKPSKRVPLAIPCTGINCDPKAVYEWNCKKCKSIVEYGFDDFVYCNCGKTPALLLEFRCPDEDHGNGFERHEENYFSEVISALRPFQEMNILILGETGVGKSTFINGFINFLTYDSLEEAEQGELRTLIPSEFTVCNEDYEEIVVSTGTDTNEVQQAGQSATQDSKVYPFAVGNLTIRLIDTPGIGDTRGIQQDKKNFENILGTLSYLDELHGILILLKPNSARLNVMFRFCIKELLTYLHKDASKNIVFCFTNSRGTFYRPGDTMPALKSLLAENEDVQIPISRNTIYCFDSEAYRFLAAVKNDPPVNFADCERENFSKSWDKSLAEISRLLEHIADTEPHKIKNTLSLNQTRSLVLKLARPLAEINRNIIDNKNIISRYKEMIENTDEDIDQLSQQVKEKRFQLQSTKLDLPKTVCGHSSCITYDFVDGTKSVVYIRDCHNPCYVSGVQACCKGDPGLLGCFAFGGTDHCQKSDCRHHYTDHLHIYFELARVETEIENEAVKASLNEQLTAKEMKQKMLEEKNQEIEEYDYELQYIEKASVRFAYFLKSNAITPYNDAIEQYLDHLIQEEENLANKSGDRDTVDNLKITKASYQEQKRILEENMDRGGEYSASPPTPEEIKELVDKLGKLKHSGQALREALTCVDHSKAVVYQEVVSSASVYTGKKSTKQEKKPSSVKQAVKDVFNFFKRF